MTSPVYVAAITLAVGGINVSSIIAGTGISVAGSTGAVTISLPSIISAGTFGDSAHIPIVTVDVTGRVTGISTETVASVAVSSITGTANEIIASGSVGAITLSLPQAINTGAAPSFAGTNFTSIPNGALTNNTVTVGSTSIALGASATTIAGLTSVTSTTFVGALTGNASTATSATTATNMAGGTANQIAYQTGAGASSFFSAANYGVQIYGSTGVPTSLAGAAGVLVGSAGANPAFSTTPTLTGTNFTGIPNAGLSNASLTIGSTSIALGATVTSFAGVTLTSPTFTGPALGTPVSGTLTSCTFPTLNQSTTGTAALATSIAAGTANQIPYQTAAGTTSFFSAANYGVQIYGSTGVPTSVAGAAGVLVGSAGANPAFSTTPTLTGTNFSG